MRPITNSLSFEDFGDYAQRAKLGRLNLPNGRTIRFLDYSKNMLFVELSDLYKLINKFIASYGLASANILAVIAMGSSVIFPGYRENYNIRRRFIMFGPIVVKNRTIPIQPNDVDFFVLTDKSLGYDGAHLKRGVFHIIGRNIDQVAQSREVNDTVTINALNEGVPMFFDERLRLLAARAGITAKTPRKIYWKEDTTGRLTGTIK